jgi:hypothetical protein
MVQTSRPLLLRSPGCYSSVGTWDSPPTQTWSAKQRR